MRIPPVRTHFDYVKFILYNIKVFHSRLIFLPCKEAQVCGFVMSECRFVCLFRLTTFEPTSGSSEVNVWSSCH